MQQIDKLRAKPTVYMLNLGIPFCCVCDQKESFPHCSIANNNAPKLNILKEFLGTITVWTTNEDPDYPLQYSLSPGSISV